MKALITFISSLILTVLLLAPSIIILDNDQNSFAIELNEDEKNKEEKKELCEDDFFVENYFQRFSISKENSLNQSLSHLIYLNFNYSNTLEIFLPPPELFV